MENQDEGPPDDGIARGSCPWPRPEHEHQAGDTCNSIAVSQNVSTWAVYDASGIRDCSNLPTGSSLYLQGQCWLYQVKETNTCDSIIAAARIKVSPSTFVAWNPNINPVCTNLFSSVGDYICLRLVFLRSTLIETDSF